MKKTTGAKPSGKSTESSTKKSPEEKPRIDWKTAPIGKFWWLVGYIQAQHPEWRRGQTEFNVLETVRPELANLIRATGIDPFYIAHLDRPDSEQKMQEFCDFVEKNW